MVPILLLLSLLDPFPQSPAESRAQPPLRVATSTPDLASLARSVGGDAVEVTAFVKGAEDPHFVEARPGFVKALSQADLWIEVGLELESGWAPVLLQQCRNGRVLRGMPGFLDASAVITPLGVPTGKVDRAGGDVHAAGNPHYLLDPMNGWRVAQAIRDALGTLRPEAKPKLAERTQELGRRLGEAMVGKRLADKYEWEKLVLLHEHGKLDGFLEAQKDGPLQGWLGAVAPFRGAKVVVDHDLWPYFARRFGLAIVATLEPLPGVPPTARHLEGVVARVEAEGVKAILAAPYYDVRHAELVAKKTGARVVRMAHQTGGRPGTDDYLTMLDHDVRSLVEALRAR